jgi:hypothetical protein
MIIRLTDIIKSYAIVDYEDDIDESPFSMYLCHHVSDILTSAGMRPNPDGWSWQFFTEWCKKVLGFDHEALSDKWNNEIRYNLLEDWNANTKFGEWAFSCEFLNEGVRYSCLTNGRQYRQWVLGHVLEEFGDIEFEFSEVV